VPSPAIEAPATPPNLPRRGGGAERWSDQHRTFPDILSPASQSTPSPLRGGIKGGGRPATVSRLAHLTENEKAYTFPPNQAFLNTPIFPRTPPLEPPKQSPISVSFAGTAGDPDLQKGLPPLGADDVQTTGTSTLL
jgi:hypothetical protein